MRKTRKFFLLVSSCLILLHGARSEHVLSETSGEIPQATEVMQIKNSLTTEHRIQVPEDTKTPAENQNQPQSGLFDDDGCREEDHIQNLPKVSHANVNGRSNSRRRLLRLVRFSGREDGRRVRLAKNRCLQLERRSQIDHRRDLRTRRQSRSSRREDEQCTRQTTYSGRLLSTESSGETTRRLRQRIDNPQSLRVSREEDSARMIRRERSVEKIEGDSRQARLMGRRNRINGRAFEREVNAIPESDARRISTRYSITDNRRVLARQASGSNSIRANRRFDGRRSSDRQLAETKRSTSRMLDAMPVRKSDNSFRRTSQNIPDETRHVSERFSVRVLARSRGATERLPSRRLASLRRRITETDGRTYTRRYNGHVTQPPVRRSLENRFSTTANDGRNGIEYTRRQQRLGNDRRSEVRTTEIVNRRLLSESRIERMSQRSRSRTAESVERSEITARVRKERTRQIRVYDTRQSIDTKMADSRRISSTERRSRTSKPSAMYRTEESSESGYETDNRRTRQQRRQNTRGNDSKRIVESRTGDRRRNRLAVSSERRARNNGLQVIEQEPINESTRRIKNTERSSRRTNGIRISENRKSQTTTRMERRSTDSKLRMVNEHPNSEYRTQRERMSSIHRDTRLLNERQISDNRRSRSVSSMERRSGEYRRVAISDESHRRLRRDNLRFDRQRSRDDRFADSMRIMNGNTRLTINVEKRSKNNRQRMSDIEAQGRLSRFNRQQRQQIRSADSAKDNRNINPAQVRIDASRMTGRKTAQVFRRERQSRNVDRSDDSDVHNKLSRNLQRSDRERRLSTRSVDLSRLSERLSTTTLRRSVSSDRLSRSTTHRIHDNLSTISHREIQTQRQRREDRQRAVILGATRQQRRESSQRTTEDFTRRQRREDMQRAAAFDHTRRSRVDSQRHTVLVYTRRQRKEDSRRSVIAARERTRKDVRLERQARENTYRLRNHANGSGYSTETETALSRRRDSRRLSESFKPNYSENNIRSRTLSTHHRRLPVSLTSENRYMASRMREEKQPESNGRFENLSRRLESRRVRLPSVITSRRTQSSRRTLNDVTNRQNTIDNNRSRHSSGRATRLHSVTVDSRADLKREQRMKPEQNRRQNLRYMQNANHDSMRVAVGAFRRLDTSRVISSAGRRRTDIRLHADEYVADNRRRVDKVRLDYQSATQRRLSDRIGSVANLVASRRERRLSLSRCQSPGELSDSGYSTTSSVRCGYKWVLVSGDSRRLSQRGHDQQNTRKQFIRRQTSIALSNERLSRRRVSNNESIHSRRITRRSSDGRQHLCSEMNRMASRRLISANDDSRHETRSRRSVTMRQYLSRDSQRVYSNLRFRNEGRVDARRNEERIALTGFVHDSSVPQRLSNRRVNSVRRQVRVTESRRHSEKRVQPETRLNGQSTRSLSGFMESLAKLETTDMSRAARRHRVNRGSTLRARSDDSRNVITMQNKLTSRMNSRRDRLSTTRRRMSFVDKHIRIVGARAESARQETTARRQGTRETRNHAVVRDGKRQNRYILEQETRARKNRRDTLSQKIGRDKRVQRIHTVRLAKSRNENRAIAPNGQHLLQHISSTSRFSRRESRDGESRRQRILPHVNRQAMTAMTGRQDALRNRQILTDSDSRSKRQNAERLSVWRQSHHTIIAPKNNRINFLPKLHSLEIPKGDIELTTLLPAIRQHDASIKIDKNSLQTSESDQSDILESLSSKVNLCERYLDKFITFTSSWSMDIPSFSRATIVGLIGLMATPRSKAV